MSKKLAKKGRFGDNKIRMVDGKPAHVNPSEAKLLDRKGKFGEMLVKAQGAGTINPRTGLKEYHKSSLAHNALHRFGGDKIAHSSWKNIGQNVYDATVEGADKAVDYVKENPAEIGTLVAMGLSLFVDPTGKLAVKIGPVVYKSLSELEDAFAKQEIAEEDYNNAKEAFENEKKYRENIYDAQVEQYEYLYGREDDPSTPDIDESTQGYYGDVHDQQMDSYNRLWGEDGYYAQAFGSQMETYNALKDAYTKQIGYTPTETEMQGRFKKLIEEGDPELQAILDESARLALGSIRQQGAENVQTAQGQVIRQGLENSIVAQDILARTDKQTLKSLSETARKIAVENKNAQLGVRRQAQSDLDRLNLSGDARKRTALTNLAGLTEPIMKVAPTPPIAPPKGQRPVYQPPGTAPTDRSGLYDPNTMKPLFDLWSSIDTYNNPTTDWEDV